MTGDAQPKLVKFKPARDVVHENCSQMLKDAPKRSKGRCGIAAAAYVVVHPDGSVGSSFIAGEHAFALLGAVAALQHRVQTEVIDE